MGDMTREVFIKSDMTRLDQQKHKLREQVFMLAAKKFVERGSVKRHGDLNIRFKGDIIKNSDLMKFAKENDLKIEN